MQKKKNGEKFPISFGLCLFSFKNLLFHFNVMHAVEQAKKEVYSKASKKDTDTN